MRRTENYTREDVEKALWLMWDPDWPYGPGADPEAPDGDMPRSFVDPSKGGTWMAELADVRRAWDRAGLTLTEKQRLCLYFFKGGTLTQLGKSFNVSRESFSDSFENGMNKILRAVNNVEEA